MSEDKIKGMHTCDVCGRDFPLTAEGRYTARGTERSGIAIAISLEEAGRYDAFDYYDAFDCPYCQCQNLVNRRLREPEPEGGDRPTCDREECGCHEGERTGGEGVSDGE